MVDEKLARYVVVARTRGFSEEKIRQKLLAAGWPSYSIDEAFYYSTNPDARRGSFLPPKVKSASTAKSFFSKGMFKGVPPMFFGALVILAIILVFSAFFTFSLLGEKGAMSNGTVATGAITAPTGIETSASGSNNAPPAAPLENNSTAPP